jgi:TonB family protein
MTGELELAQRSLEVNPGYRALRAKTFAVAILLHIVVIMCLVRVGRSPIRIGTEAASESGIPAFVIPAPQPTATTGIAKPSPRPKPNNREELATARVAQEDSTASSLGTRVDTPVRIGSGERLGLIKKVDPFYPPALQAAGVSGVVVLDAIIHRDGTIGDVTVLKSSNAAFEQAAIDAVRQWRYTPLPYEGIVSVTIRFTP